MMDDTSSVEWFAWRQRNRLVSEMRSCGCARKATRLSNAVALVEALYG